MRRTFHRLGGRELPITERIWLRAFGIPPKFPFREL